MRTAAERGVVIRLEYRPGRFVVAGAAIALVAGKVRSDDQREALLRHATMVERGSHEGLSEEWDRRDAQERFSPVVRVIEEGKEGG